MNYLTQNALVFFVSATITIYFVPIVRKVGFKLGITDKPNKRKQHKESLVRIGGLALILGFYLSIIFAFFTVSYDMRLYFLNNENYYISLLVFSLLIFILGFIDDIFDLPPLSRLSFQFIIAFITIRNGLNFSGVEISFFWYSFYSLSVPFFFTNFISIFWLSGVTNAFNWIDGLDGLAAGVGIISSLSISIYNLQINNPIVSLIAASLAGSCLGFLKYNFKNASILMGDGGSYFIGFNLAGLILMSCKSDIKVLEIIPLILFIAVPLFDMASVILKRIYNGKSPFRPDRSHFHHVLLNYGISTEPTVYIIYALSIFSAAFGLIMF